MQELVVYSRPGCHLCELFLEELLPLCRGRARVTVRNVDLEHEWAERYGLRIPVLCHADREICAVHLDREALRALLG